MRGTDFQFPLKVLKCLMIAVTIIITGIFVSSLLLNQDQSAVAQQQSQLGSNGSNQTVYHVKQQQQPFVSKGLSFDIDNVAVGYYFNICYPIDDRQSVV